MKKAKHVNSHRPTKSEFFFGGMLGIFLVSLIATSLISYPISKTYYLENLVHGLNLILLTAAVGLLLNAFVQIQVVERVLGRAMRGWMLYTIAGLAATWVLRGYQSPFYMELIFFHSISFEKTVLFLIVIFIGSFFSGLSTLVFQDLRLRRQLRATWLWLMVGVVSLLVTSGLNQLITSGLSQLTPLSPASDGLRFFVRHVMFLVDMTLWIISGLATYWLVSVPLDTQKSKHEAANDETTTQASLNRLQETDKHTHSWDSSDESLSLRKSESH